MLTVLIVDDSRLMQAAIRHALEMIDTPIDVVFTAGNGNEALERLETTDVDLMFLDIFMPEMNGLELVDHLAETGRIKALPVIIISSDGSQTHMEQLRENGVKAFIRKPFTPEAIQEAVDSVIQVNHDS